MKNLIVILSVFSSSIFAQAAGNYMNCAQMVNKTVKLYHEQNELKKVAQAISTLGAVMNPDGSSVNADTESAGLVTVAEKKSTEISARYWVKASYSKETCLVQSIEKLN